MVFGEDMATGELVHGRGDDRRVMVCLVATQSMMIRLGNEEGMRRKRE